MSSSLIPERPLLVSPSLAATIGLEEACMLSVLSDVAAYHPLVGRDGQNWLDIDEALVVRAMPFWSPQDIQRISKNLRDQGIILLASAPFTESRRLTLAFNDSKASRKLVETHQPFNNNRAESARPFENSRPFENNRSFESRPLPIINMGGGANLMSPNWQPDRELMRQVAQHNIPEDFVRQQVPEFITYWRERGETSHSWGAKFLKDVLHKWRNHQTHMARQARENNEEFLNREKDIAMHINWRPSKDALEVLVKHATISYAFVEDAIPEFVLYWQERGEVGRTWNSKFIQHVKRQWVRYSSALEHDTEPKRIPENWQPSNEVFDVLRLAEIKMDFAQRQVAEFVLFWRESNQLYASWNTKFLQHVKYHWAKQHALAPLTQQGNHHAGQQNVNPTRSTRDRSLAEDLTDRSWAQ